MDIAIISDHACPAKTQGSIDAGGQNIYVAQLAENLSKMGHKVEVFTRKEKIEDPLIEIMPAGYTLLRVPAGPEIFIPKEQLLPHMKDFEKFIESYFLAKNKIPDVIHANFFMSGLVAMNLKKKLRIPFFITFHALGKVRRKYQFEKDLFPDIRFDIEEDIISSADGVIAECPQDFADLINLYDANPSKIKIIPCGFDPLELEKVDRDEARKHLKFDSDEFIILHLGRLVPRKGAENIIRALPLLRDTQLSPEVKYRLIIVGGEHKNPDPKLNPEIQRLLRIAEDLKVSEVISFTGRCDRTSLKYFYSAADIFVTTPWYEPFGITPLEAMACGIPVIGSNVGGLKYSIDDGVTGLLIPPEDPLALKEAIQLLLENQDLRKEMGHSARERVFSYFRWEIMAEQFSEIFSQLKSSRNPYPYKEVEHDYRYFTAR